MEEHECLHEVDFALIQKNIIDIKECQEKMLKLLRGNNSEGMATTVALHGQSLKRLWWFIGSISLCILSGAVGAIFLITRQ